MIKQQQEPFNCLSGESTGPRQLVSILACLKPLRQKSYLLYQNNMVFSYLPSYTFLKLLNNEWYHHRLK